MNGLGLLITAGVVVCLLAGGAIWAGWRASRARQSSVLRTRISAQSPPPADVSAATTSPAQGAAGAETPISVGTNEPNAGGGDEAVSNVLVESTPAPEIVAAEPISGRDPLDGDRSNNDAAADPVGKDPAAWSAPVPHEVSSTQECPFRGAPPDEDFSGAPAPETNPENGDGNVATGAAVPSAPNSSVPPPEDSDDSASEEAWAPGTEAGKGPKGEVPQGPASNSSAHTAKDSDDRGDATLASGRGSTGEQSDAEDAPEDTSDEPATTTEPAVADGPPAAEERQQDTKARTRPKAPARHRDQRGRRRAAAPANAAPGAPPTATPRFPAEVRLRLLLYEIRRSVTLSAVLARAEGFPERVNLLLDGQPAIEAYDASRYDDLDLTWTRGLLAGEFRIGSREGFQWLRSGRRVHIFAESPGESGLISVGAARLGLVHAVICRSSDVEEIRAAAIATGSPPLVEHERWRGIPEGWSILSGYKPQQMAAPPLPTSLMPLDPGASIEIVFTGGLPIRPRAFAEGNAPRIEIVSLPEDASVTIGGRLAVLGTGGGWEAPGWDSPGHHMVDVVPGPSLGYEIVADPGRSEGWPFLNAHKGRFGERVAGSWARAEICGAILRGPLGEVVLAAETAPLMVGLGLRRGMAILEPRSNIPVSVALMPVPPAFLLSATGQRRTQGQVIWVGLVGPQARSTRSDPAWVATVRSATGRRLPIVGADAAGEQAWRKAKQRARRRRKRRT